MQSGVLRGPLGPRALGSLAVERDTAHQMLDEARRVVGGEPRVPDAVPIRIDDGVGPVEARAEALARRDQGLVGAAREQLVLHRRDQRIAATRTARRFAG